MNLYEFYFYFIFIFEKQKHFLTLSGQGLRLEVVTNMAKYDYNFSVTLSLLSATGGSLGSISENKYLYFYLFYTYLQPYSHTVISHQAYHRVFLRGWRTR